MDEDLPDRLRENAADRAAAVLRAALGALPAGSLVAELVDRIIPNQRSERFAHYLAAVSRRLTAVHGRLDEVERLVRGSGPTQRALFEDGAEASVRAITAERIESIAQIVAVGMTEDEEAAQRERLLLDLLTLLSDDDVALLWAKADPEKGAARRQREQAVATQRLTARAAASDRETAIALIHQEEEARTIGSFQTTRLVRVGALTEIWQAEAPRPRLDGGVTVPLPRMRGHQVSPVAVLLLKRLARQAE